MIAISVIATALTLTYLLTYTPYVFLHVTQDAVTGKSVEVQQCAHSWNAHETFYWNQGTLYLYVCDEVGKSQAMAAIKQITTFESLPTYLQLSAQKSWLNNTRHEWGTSIRVLVIALVACWILLYVVTWVLRGFIPTTK